MWKHVVTLQHMEGYGGEDKALNVGKNKWDQPVGPARSRGGDLSQQGDLFQAYLQECWQWGIYNKTPKSLIPTSISFLRKLWEVSSIKRTNQESRNRNVRKRESYIGKGWRQINACALRLKCSQSRKQQDEISRKRQRNVPIHYPLGLNVRNTLWKDFIIHLDNFGEKVVETKKVITNK